MRILSHFHSLPDGYRERAMADSDATHGRLVQEDSVGDLPTAIDYGIVWHYCDTDWKSVKCRHSRIQSNTLLFNIPAYP